ncbi:MAG TPA: hypothetical protein VGG72_02780 [Bryobacteraceae bacterium]|jgi:hypothetical protein
MSTKAISLILAVLVLATLGFAGFRAWKKRVPSIASAPGITTPEQKANAQAYDSAAKAFLKASEQTAERLDTESAAAKQTGNTEVAAKKAETAKEIRDNADTYRSQVQDYSNGRPTSPAPNQPATPQEPAPPPQSSGPDLPPVPPAPPAGASDAGLDQNTVDLAALGICVVKPELCLAAKALASLIGHLDGDTKRVLVKLLAGGKLGDLNEKDIRTLLDAARKNPDLQAKVADFLGKEAGGTDAFAKQAKVIQDGLDRIVNTGCGELCSNLEHNIDSACSALVDFLPHHKFPSVDTKSIVKDLVTVRLRRGDVWDRCFDKVEVE